MWTERCPLASDEDWKVTFRFCYMEVTFNPDKHNFSEITGQSKVSASCFSTWMVNPALGLWRVGLINPSSSIPIYSSLDYIFRFLSSQGSPSQPNYSICVYSVQNRTTNQPIPGFSHSDLKKLAIFFVYLCIHIMHLLAHSGSRRQAKFAQG